MRTTLRLIALTTFLVLGVHNSDVQAQGWDYGRNMFGFAQYYPGSGWSSYYHPQFDAQAWYPTMFGVRSSGYPQTVGNAGRPPKIRIHPDAYNPPRGLVGWLHDRRRSVGGRPDHPH